MCYFGPSLKICVDNTVRFSFVLLSPLLSIYIKPTENIFPSIYLIALFLHFFALFSLFLAQMYRSRQHHLPCLYCHPHSYIRMVQHLIERCLLFHMNQDQCIKALAEHARIRPLVTLTVWKELQKENKEFFRAYFQAISPRPFMIRGYCQRGPRLARRKQWK